MSRIPVIGGNWKMNKVVGEAVETSKKIVDLVKDVSDNAEVFIAPPFTALDAVGKVIKGSNIGLGAQDLFWEDEGAFTGEVSPSMLEDIGCSYVIAGHSERRQYFKESNDEVNKKVMAILRHNLTPVMCIGEKLEEREEGKTFDVVRDHISNGLAGISSDEVKKLAIAYEPVWAIGTGKTATPQQAEEVHSYIRYLLLDMYDSETADAVRIIYGGSVKPDNISDLMEEDNIDGGLIGGASLDPESFSKIVHFQQ